MKVQTTTQINQSQYIVLMPSRMAEGLRRRFLDAVKHYKQLMEETRKTIPPQLQREGDATLTEIYKLVRQLFDIVQRVEGVKLSEEEISFAAVVPTLLVQVFAGSVLELYARGYDIETAIGATLVRLLRDEAITIVFAAFNLGLDVDLERELAGGEQ